MHLFLIFSLLITQSSQTIENSSSVQLRIVLPLGGHINCKGCLIAPDTVLTAAHCFRNIISLDNTDVEITAHAQKRKSFKLKLHPEHQLRRFDNDLAIIYLEKKFEVNSDVSAAIPARYETFPGSFVFRSNGVRGTVVSSDVAEGFYGKGFPWRKLLCVTMDDGHEGICEGDSGSPLFDQSGSLIGIASFGPHEGKSKPGQPDCFSSTYFHKDFINQKENLNNKD